MAGNLTAQVRNIAEVTTAVAKGDLSQKDHGGGERRNFGTEKYHEYDGGSAELVRVGSNACGAEVGTEGKLGGQAKVKGVAGTWKDLTDSVNRWRVT